EPDAVREELLERARRLDGEPALADAGRAGQRDESVLLEQRSDAGELVGAPDEGRGRRREVAAAPADGRRGGDGRIVREDRLLQPAKLRARLETELVVEHAPRLLERVERVRLTAAAVERQHQLAPQPLPEGIVRERRPE